MFQCIYLHNKTLSDLDGVLFMVLWKSPMNVENKSFW